MEKMTKNVMSVSKIPGKEADKRKNNWLEREAETKGRKEVVEWASEDTKEKKGGSRRRYRISWGAERDEWRRTSVGTEE